MGCGASSKTFVEPLRSVGGSTSLPGEHPSALYTGRAHIGNHLYFVQFKLLPSGDAHIRAARIGHAFFETFKTRQELRDFVHAQQLSSDTLLRFIEESLDGEHVYLELDSARSLHVRIPLSINHPPLTLFLHEVTDEILRQRNTELLVSDMLVRSHEHNCMHHQDSILRAASKIEDTGPKIVRPPESTVTDSVTIRISRNEEPSTVGSLPMLRENRKAREPEPIQPTSAILCTSDPSQPLPAIPGASSLETEINVEKQFSASHIRAHSHPADPSQSLNVEAKGSADSTPRTVSQVESDGLEDDSAVLQLPIEKCIDVLRKIINWADEEKIEFPVLKQLDYVVAVLVSNNLYSPEITSSKNEPSTSSSAIHDAQDEEISSFVRTELLAPTPRYQPLDLIRNVRGFLGAYKFANVLKRKAQSKIVQRMNPGSPELLIPILGEIDRWSFNVFDISNMTGRPLFYSALTILYKYGLFAKLNVDESKVKAFLTEIEKSYRPNPYHNNIHAADVTQTLFYFINKGEFDSSLSDLDLFSAVIAAVVHDVDHPGLNNNFLIRTEDQKALVYNDQSVLEMHHCKYAFSLLRLPEYNFIENFTNEQKKQFRDTIIQMILATDMGKHFDFVGKFKTFSEFDSSNRNSVILLLQCLLKCADVSNPAKPLPIYRLWTDRVMEEFYQQGDNERQLDLPISPFMDRLKPSKAKCQVGFIDFLTKPLYETLVSMVPSLKGCLSQMKQNRQFWAQQLEEKSVASTSS